jgi:hypothetical protein
MTLPGETEENYERIPIMIAGLRVEIWTRNLQSKMQDC